jgi:hypothetical protein
METPLASARAGSQFSDLARRAAHGFHHGGRLSELKSSGWQDYPHRSHHRSVRPEHRGGNARQIDTVIAIDSDTLCADLLEILLQLSF